MVFTVQLDDKTTAPAESAAGAVAGLSAQFDALQGQLRAAEAALNATNVQLMQQANLARAAAQAASIQAEQQRNLAYHDKNAFKGASESDILSDVAAQQQANLAAHAQTAAAALGREKAILASIAAEQKKNLAMHDQAADAAAGVAKMREKAAADELAGRSAQQTAKWFGDLQKASKNGDDALLGFTTQLRSLVPAATAVIAVVGVLSGAVGKLMGLAIGATQEKDALREMFGGQTLDMLEEMSQKLPYTTDELAKFATSLQAAGYSGTRLRSAIEAVAAAGARKAEWAAGADALLKKMMALEETGTRLKLDAKFEKQLFAAGINLQDVAKALGVNVDKLKTMNLTAQQAGDAIQKALVQKGAGALAAMGQRADVIWGKIKEGVNDAFEDLGDLVHPFMTEIQSLASEFFKGSVASKGLAGVVRAVLAPAFQFGTQAVHWLHLAFLTLEVYVLRARIALLPVTNALDKIGVSSALVSVGMYLLKGTMITLAVVFGVLALGAALLALPFIVIGVAIYAVVSAVEYLVDAISKVDLTSLATEAATAGRNMITGLGNAIASGAAWVVSLVTDLASSIIGAITGPLKIHSPSRVMRQLGGHITMGLAEGVEQGTPQVTAAAYGAGDAAVGGTAAGASGGGRGGGGITINGGVHIEVPMGTPQGWAEEAFAAFMERLQARAGA